MAAIETAIAAVTVFTDRARVTRRGAARLVAGEQTLAIENVPDSLDESSVRASGRGAGVKILGVEVTTNYITNAPEAKVADLQAQLEELQERDRALADEDAAQAARLHFLDKLSEAGGVSLARGVAYGKGNMESVVSLSDYLLREREAALARRRELAKGRRDLAREISALESQLGQLQNYTSYTRREIHVSVEAAAETEFELEVVYAVYNASWQPLYDIRLVESAVAVTYLANVQQQTGEDWPAVQLYLSTARPAVSHDIPELDPWYIDRYYPMPPPPPRGGMAMPMMAASMAPAQESEGMVSRKRVMADAPAAEVAQAEIESGGAAVTYKVARPVAVPADGSPHKTTVTALDLPAALDYVVVPKLAEEAYLRAKVRNISPFIFLPGEALIFHEADFVGRTSLETVAPSEEFEAQMGVDDRIKVERELTERQMGKAFIGNTRRTAFAYKITLTNHLATEAKVTLYDQLPVGRHEEIKSKLQNANPPPVEQSGLNILKWELVVPPGKKVEVSFAFSVEHPRDMQVTNLGV